MVEPCSNPVKRKHITELTDGQGRARVSKGELSAFVPKSWSDKAKLSKEQWATLEWVLLKRAQDLSRSATKKEMGHLRQLVTSAAIARDKAYGSDEGARSSNMLALIFSGSNIGHTMARSLFGDKERLASAKVIDGEATPLAGTELAKATSVPRVSD